MQLDKRTLELMLLVRKGEIITTDLALERARNIACLTLDELRDPHVAVELVSNAILQYENQELDSIHICDLAEDLKTRLDGAFELAKAHWV